MSGSHRRTEVDIWVARTISGFLLIAKKTGCLCCCCLTGWRNPSTNPGVKRMTQQWLSLFGGKNPCTNSSKKEKENRQGFSLCYYEFICIPKFLWVWLRRKDIPNNYLDYFFGLSDLEVLCCYTEKFHFCFSIFYCIWINFCKLESPVFLLAKIAFSWRHFCWEELDWMEKVFCFLWNRGKKVYQPALLRGPPKMNSKSHNLKVMEK